MSESQNEYDVYLHLLRALHILSDREISPLQIKTVFELGLAKVTGHAPDLSGCGCGGQIRLFSPLNSSVVCELCRPDDGLRVNAGMYDAMRYIIAAKPNRMYNFELSEPSVKRLSEISELYIAGIIGQRLPTLDYYEKISSPI
jgi:recombinational DNA repair protein (RecF pathway)